MSLRRGNARSRALTLVAIGALLGVKILRRHGKHLVALDADAVNNALGAVRGRGVLVVGAWRLGFVPSWPDSNTGRPSSAHQTEPAPPERTSTRSTMSCTRSGRCSRSAPGSSGAGATRESTTRTATFCARLPSASRVGRNFQFRGIDHDDRRRNAASQRLPNIVGGFQAQRVDARFSQLGSHRRAQLPIARNHENDRHRVAENSILVSGRA